MQSQNQLVQSTNSRQQLVKQSNTLIEHCVNSEEVDLVRAIFDSVIVSKDGDSIGELIEVLAQWRWMSGVNVQNQDDDDVARELALISRFVSTNYPKLTLDEIRLAIDLSLTDKLDCDVRTFNVFSPMYVSRILNAYNEYKKQVFAPIRERKSNAEAKKELERVPTPSEKMDSMKELITYFYEEYKSKGIMNDYFSTIYIFLRRTKIINIPKNVIDEALEYGKQMAIKHINDNFDLVISREKPNRETLEKRFARNYCVQKYFDQVNLDSILSHVNINHFTDV